MDEKTIIINVGMARSGTTAINTYFSENKIIRVPKGIKELKAFFEDRVDFQKYLNAFQVAKNNEIFFESSPPYMHSGVKKYEKVLKCILDTVNRNIKFVFNVRPLSSRAFSHYWHDINKQYSIYGKAWSVKSMSDPNRYKTIYRKSFLKAINTEADKFCPDLGGMLHLSAKKIGWENIYIIPQDDLKSGVSSLLGKVGIADFGPEVRRIPGAMRPLFFTEGEHFLPYSGRKFEVPKSTLLRVGHKGLELLKADRYPINDIYCSSKMWTDQVSSEEMHQVMGSYLEEQAEKLKDVPSGCLLGDFKEGLISYVLKIKDERIGSYELDPEKLEEVGL